MKKLDISEEIKNEIIEKFNSGISIRKIVDDYSFSFTVIQKLCCSKNNSELIEINYPQKERYNMVAVCRLTKKEISDYKNISGAIARHVFALYPEEKNKSKFIRKSQEYKTNKFWYDEYFNFEYRLPELVETKKCHYCDWVTTDINNRAGAYGNHLLNVHNKTPKDYLVDNPSDKSYFKHVDEPEPSGDAIVCKICGKLLNQINNTHLKKHNISVIDYKIKYGGVMFSETTKEKMIINWNERLKDCVFRKSSSYERLVVDLIPNVQFELNDRKILNGLEIDLLSVENKIGIEINGLFYHSEIGGGKNKNYHLNKTILANENGISLIHIFEDEIKNKENIVIDKLKHIFGVNDSIRIHGRKCDIIELKQNEKNDFIEKYHIQGNTSSTHNIGATYNNELVAVMLFNNKRPMNKELLHNENIYELVRFATKSNYIINGIASKILNFFILKYYPQKIISFADRRWTLCSNNNLYTKLGFILAKTLPPDYTYFNTKISRCNRLHKFGFGKSSLKKYYPEIYDDSKTEWQMMQELGYDRVWDCGKFKYELNL